MRPSGRLSRSQGEARVRVTSVVQSEWTRAFRLSLTSQPLPRSGRTARWIIGRLHLKSSYLERNYP